MICNLGLNSDPNTNFNSNVNAHFDWNFGVFDFSFYHTSNMKYDANMSPVGVSMVHLA